MLSGPGGIHCLKIGQVHLQSVDQEAPQIGHFLDDLAGGFASSVARLGLDPDKHRRGTRLGGLQGGGEFIAVGRHHPVIVIGGGDERRRVTGAGSKIVKRGVGQQRLELLGILRSGRSYTSTSSDWGLPIRW